MYFKKHSVSFQKRCSFIYLNSNKIKYNKIWWCASRRYSFQCTLCCKSSYGNVVDHCCRESRDLLTWFVSGITVLGLFLGEGVTIRHTEPKRIVNLRSQEVTARLHWLPVYIKDSVVKQVCSRYGEFIDVI